MDISNEQKEISKYLTFINEKLSTQNEDNYELECLFKNLNNLTQSDFQKIYTFLDTSKNFIYQNNLNEEKLDCRIVSGNFLENFRITINNINNILAYCKSNNIKLVSHEIIEKKRIKSFPSIDLENYPIRLNLKLENELNDNNNGDIIKTIYSIFNKSKKYFRYKKTYSFLTKNKLFRIDLSLIKKSNNYTTSLYNSGILQQKASFELEIELMNNEFVKLIEKNKDNIKNVINEMFNIIGNLLMQISNSIVLIGDSEKKLIFDEYLKLGFSLNDKDINKLNIRNPRKYFIGVQPITLELKNLLQPKEDIVSLLENYNVTEKADGERNLIYIGSNNKLYLINNRLSLKYTGLISVNDLEGTLMDGEYITKDKMGNNINEIAIFDIYFYKKKNIADKIFYIKQKKDSENIKITRHHLLEDIFSKKNNFKIDTNVENKKINIFLKTFLFNTTQKMFYKNTKKILNNSYEYHTDGLIFTPNHLSVGSYYTNDETRLQGSWKRVFKWKPPEENTIDFLIRFIEIIESNINDVNKKYMYCKLYVGYDENIEIKPFDILNHRFEDNIYGIKEFAECYIEIHNLLVNGKNKEIVYTLDNKELLNGMIVEMSYDNNENNEFLKWKPNRIRYDKTELYKITKSISGTANDYSTALNVWNSIQHPITIDIITGKEEISEEIIEQNKSEVYYSRENKREFSLLKPMLDFHNYWVKHKFLYERLSNKNLDLKSLFDIACGKGGDLNKWINSKYNIVIGSDISTDNLYNINDGLYKRYNQLVKNNTIRKDSKNNKNVDMAFFIADASEKWSINYLLNKNIKDENSKEILGILTGNTKKKDINPNSAILLNLYNVINKQFSAISCMFAIHYMFENEKKLDNFISNIDMLLKKNGYFFGTCLDGYLVNKELSNNKELRGIKNDKTIWLIEKKYDNYETEPLNNIGKKIDVYMETINQTIEEYLVDYELLKMKLAKYNILPVKSSDLKEINMETFKNSTGSFEEIYDYYKDDEKNKINKMDSIHMDYSFLNRWFIFKKY
jgi:hypothetical protein